MIIQFHLKRRGGVFVFFMKKTTDPVKNFLCFYYDTDNLKLDSVVDRTYQYLSMGTNYCGKLLDYCSYVVVTLCMQLFFS